MTDEEAVTAMVDAIVTEFGRLDILVNNAGARSRLPDGPFGVGRVD